MNDADFLKQMRSLELDHEPTGWPCVQMQQITRLLNIIDRLDEDLRNNEYYNKD